MQNEIHTVAVLMSTYNGEKYIREQINSIFNQQDVDVRLYVRDDGSSDATIDILEEYSKKYPISILVDGENVGPGESFMRLVYEHANDLDISYFAFADQDDIWLKDKLYKAVNAIRKYGNEKPVLYSSNQYLYIDGLNRGSRHEEPQKTDLISHMTKNTIAGCTFVFNKALAQFVANANRPDPRIIKYRIHDAWLMLVAIVSGTIIYDDASYMLYRIHAQNTVGIKKTSVLKRLHRLKRYFTKRDDSNLRMITAQELLRLFQNISTEDKRVLGLYANYQRSWKDKMALAFNKDIRDNCGEKSGIFIIKVLTNFV